MAWYPKEKRTILTASPMPNGGMFTFDRFPMDGLGITKIRLLLCATVVAGTNTTPNTTGCYNYLKGITLRNNRDESYFQAVPGLALLRAGWNWDKAAPHYDPVLLAGGVFRAVLDLPLVYPFLRRPEDTIVETKRLNSMTLEIACGTILDFLSVAGTGTVAVTIGIEVIGTRASIGLDRNGVPDPLAAAAIFHSYMRTYPMLHADVQTFWDLEAAPDLALLGFLLYNHGASGIPWVGALASIGNDHVTQVSFADIGHRYLNGILDLSFQHERYIWPNEDYNRHAADVTSPISQLGEYPHSFVENGSINEGYAAKLIARLEWINATATDETDLLVWGIRKLRA